MYKYYCWFEKNAFNRSKCLKIPFCLIVLHDCSSLLYSVGPENGTLNNDHAQGNGRKTERFTTMASISIKHLKWNERLVAKCAQVGQSHFTIFLILPPAKWQSGKVAISYWQFKRQTDPIYKWCQRRRRNCEAITAGQNTVQYQNIIFKEKILFFIFLWETLPVI